ncbi:MAG: zf-HC2 domain-containing protein [Planctomycetes bacterium]|nr:zf-HC2 domain-containing protein [Planctomycetota bacterium]
MTPCDILELDLSCYLDGESDPASRERVVEHLQHCAACAERVRSWRAMGSAMRESDITVNPAPRMLAAVRAEVARTEVARTEVARTTRAAPRRNRILRFERRHFAAAAVVAATITATVMMFSKASADDDVRRLIELESNNRIEAIVQSERIRAVRLDIAAMRQKYRAAKMVNADRAQMDAETVNLLERADGLEKRLAAIQEKFDREGLLVPTAGGR